MRSVRFQDGIWHEYGLTHSIDRPRSYKTYGEPSRPPMNQRRSFRKQPGTPQTVATQQSTSISEVILPTLFQNAPQFSCTLPLVPLIILTPPLPQASTGIGLLLQPYRNFTPFSRGSSRQSRRGANRQSSKQSTNKIFTGTRPIVATHNKCPKTKNGIVPRLLWSNRFYVLVRTMSVPARRFGALNEFSPRD